MISETPVYQVIYGRTGKSAFEEWREIPGNEEKTMEDFMAASMAAALGASSVLVYDETLDEP